MSSKRFRHLACRPERLSLLRVLCREKEPLSHSHLILSVILFTFALELYLGRHNPEEKPFKLSGSTTIFSSILTLLLGFDHHNSTVSSHKELPWLCSQLSLLFCLLFIHGLLFLTSLRPRILLIFSCLSFNIVWLSCLSLFTIWSPCFINLSFQLLFSYLIKHQTNEEPSNTCTCSQIYWIFIFLPYFYYYIE